VELFLIPKAKNVTKKYKDNLVTCHTIKVTMTFLSMIGQLSCTIIAKSVDKE